MVTSFPSATAPSVVVTGCAVRPSVCGFPDATNAGVPVGTVLKKVPEQVSSGTGWAWDSRGWVEVSGTNAVFEGYDVAANVNVTGAGASIRNNRIHQANGMFGVSVRRADNVTIQGNTIYGGSAGADRMMVGVKDIYGGSANLKVLGNDIYWTSTGVQTDAGLIQDNYIHDMGYAPGDHLNGTTSNGGTTQLTIRHNTVFNAFQQTDAISLFQDFGTQANRLIDNNLLAGGGYTLYSGSGSTAPSSNIKITNNRFSTLYHPNGGYYGPVTAYAPTGTGNTWDDTGNPANN
jgi:hypothetical protein